MIWALARMKDIRDALDGLRTRVASLLESQSSVLKKQRLFSGSLGSQQAKMLSLSVAQLRVWTAKLPVVLERKHRPAQSRANPKPVSCGV